MEVDSATPDKKHFKSKHGESSKKRRHEANSPDGTSEKKPRKEKSDKKHKEKSGKKDKKDKSKDKYDGSHQQASLSAPEASTPTATTSSPFHSITSTLYLPLSPISLSQTHALASLQSEHLSPLLLTYYRPFGGIVLAYDNATLSSTPPAKDTTTGLAGESVFALARTAGEYGVLYVYLTATFLVFRPERGQTLDGWINVQTEGFLGAVVLNLFSVGIECKRLPRSWRWVGPGQGGNKAKGSAASKGGDVNVDDDDDALGYFMNETGERVRGALSFRVRDVDVIPGAERDKGFISIEGTLLPPDEEEALLAAERRQATGAERVEGVMSGALSIATPAAPPPVVSVA